VASPNALQFVWKEVQLSGLPGTKRSAAMTVEDMQTKRAKKAMIIVDLDMMLIWRWR